MCSNSSPSDWLTVKHKTANGNVGLTEGAPQELAPFRAKPGKSMKYIQLGYKYNEKSVPR